MKAPIEGRFRFQVSLRQIGLLIVFFAIQFALLSPLARSERPSPPLVLLALNDLVFLPLVSSLGLLVLLRRGPVRDWLLRALLGLQLAILMTLFLVPMIFLLAFEPSTLWTLPVLMFVPLLVIGSVIRNVAPDRCPACRRRAMIPDNWNVNPLLFESTFTRLCLSCGGRFERKSRRDAWQAVSDENGETPGPASE